MPALRQLLARSELRFALRRLRRSPGFAGAVVLVLALGVGTTTAVFSLVHGILLEPLPYPQPERLVRLTHSAGDAGAARVDQSDAMVLLYQERARAFEGIAAWRFDDGDLAAPEADHSAVRVRGARVTANFFGVLGARPVVGRGFEAGEDQPGAGRVVVLSDRLWRERFGGDPGAIGRQIVVNDVPRTVVGVMPPEFAYPGRRVELWLPLSLDPARTKPATLNLAGIGRLRPGVTEGAARADLARVLASAEDRVRGGAGRVAPHVESLRDSIVGPVSHRLWFVFGSVLLVLLVACTNVAGLILVRAERAQRELAVRAALGSGWPGMLALTLSEAVLLSVLGGAAGVLLAVAALRAVPAAGAALSLPRLEDVGAGAPVLLFALGTTALCALFVSALPLLRMRRMAVAQLLRGAGTGLPGGRAPQRGRDALVVFQIALAVVVVALSGLVTRSFVRLHQVHPGFDADGVVTSRVLLPYARYGSGSSRLGFFDALGAGARALPGTRAVALTDWVPLSGDRRSVAVDVEGARSPGEAEHAVAHVDGPFFQALGIPLRRGRTFGPQDAAAPPGEAVVSRAFAARYWPGESPVGKRVRPLGGRWHTVVGEVGDVRFDALDAPADEMVYFPLVTLPREGDATTLPAALSLVVRTDAGEGETLSAIRRIVRSLDPSLPTFDEGPLDALVRDASARARALAVLLAAAGVVTALLGAVGLYGMMAYSVSIRRRELGIRMALGARPAEVRRVVSAGALRLAGIGIGIGTACTLATSRLVRGLLYDVSPSDPVTLAATAAALLAVAWVASWIPARRAAAVHPAESLRSG